MLLPYGVRPLAKHVAPLILVPERGHFGAMNGISKAGIIMAKITHDDRWAARRAAGENECHFHPLLITAFWHINNKSVWPSKGEIIGRKIFPEKKKRETHSGKATFCMDLEHLQSEHNGCRKPEKVGHSHKIGMLQPPTCRVSVFVICFKWIFQQQTLYCPFEGASS